MNKKPINTRQNMLIQSLEGIGDILVFEAKRQKNELVLKGLEKISDFVNGFFKIREKDPDRFDQLVLSQDFRELYQKNEKEARFRLAYNPEKYLVGFSTAIKQITRVFEGAVDSKNEEISRIAVYHIVWILTALTKEAKNDLLIEQLLQKLFEVSKKAIEHNDPAMYPATARWYSKIIFDRLQKTKGSFNLGYLELFDRYFFSAAQNIIAADQVSLYEDLVSSLIDGIHISTYNHEKIWEYEHLILQNDLERYNALDREYNLENRLTALEDSKFDLDTKEKLDTWLGKFNELKTIIEKELTLDQKIKAKEIEEEIIDWANSLFKYSHLLEMVFAIGSYCLSKQKPSYIKKLWEYKQPSDADASWIGHDITPKNLDEAITLYFKKGLFERKLHFWEGHHGSGKYYKKYFILLLARILQNIRPDSTGNLPKIENYQLPDLPVFRLSNLASSMEDYIKLADELRKETDLLAEVGLNAEQVDELFDIKLVPFLKRLKEEANKQISAKQKSHPVSPNKVEQFKVEAIESFYKSAVLRDIFIKFLNTYENLTEKSIEEKNDRFGINIVDDKAAFFEEWHVSYDNWGGNYGEDLAMGENLFLLDHIVKNCRKISDTEFHETLQKIEPPENIIIFATNQALWQFFGKLTGYRPKWRSNIKQLEINGFAGWYEFNGQSMPIFEIRHQKTEKLILILDKTKIGKLIQFSPLKEDEDPQLVRDIFYMNIQAFSENSALMERFITSPEDWLKKIGNEPEQREYLQERVLIQIGERLEFQKSDDFEGYKIILKK